MLAGYVSASFALTRHRGTPFGGPLDGFTEWPAELKHASGRPFSFSDGRPAAPEVPAYD